MDFDTIHGSPEEKERREIIQDVIDRLLYNPEFKDKLIGLIGENPINESIKVKRSPKEFNYKQ